MLLSVSGETNQLADTTHWQSSFTWPDLIYPDRSIYGGIPSNMKYEPFKMIVPRIGNAVE